MSAKVMFHLDPRTKLFVLILCGILAFIIGDAGLFVLIGAMTVYLLIQGMIKKALQYLLAFGILYGVQYIIHAYVPGAAVIFGFMAFFAARFIPVTMAASALSALPPGELIAALQKLRMPKTVVIPLAVGFRFMPCIAREFSAIRDAMRLRGISFASAKCIRNPTMTIECAFVPLLMRSLKISDELAASASARGIDNPGVRTCLRRIQLSLADGVVMAVFFVVCAVAMIFFT
ncbi:cobalt transport protein [Desulfofarcimen acetoxidans DSM 771]|uniref:Cobalt transport protein n=1 Tax=Desulfofarcimen acetoxidans (strain ATCC 49208 / DSM 771 / KCTC 5769 / VKM B-1644 / 5575) TaxID=485916 RepID=C8W140_DESAS|nr:cobalt transport protein [Desulfofarcimen acetoxidans DSM 771]